jgi:hypothetical protein
MSNNTTVADTEVGDLGRAMDLWDVPHGIRAGEVLRIPYDRDVRGSHEGEVVYGLDAPGNPEVVVLQVLSDPYAPQIHEAGVLCDPYAPQIHEVGVLCGHDGREIQVVATVADVSHTQPGTHAKAVQAGEDLDIEEVGLCDRVQEVDLDSPYVHAIETDLVEKCLPYWVNHRAYTYHAHLD